MSEPPGPSRGTGATGIYVYGVVARDTSPTLFDQARGVDPAQSTVLLTDGGLAAIASRVDLVEFGRDALEANLHDAGWLEAKARAHDDVLAHAVGRTTVVPFRFGAIYESEERVREMLDRRRDLVDALTRLAGTVELGVTAYLDPERFRERLASERGLGEEAERSGRAYLQRRQLERELDEALASFSAQAGRAMHDRLAARTRDARANPLRPSTGDGREMVLNGAYLVSTDEQDDFRAAVAELGERYGCDAVSVEVTGPWPPYNFAAAESVEA